MDSNNIYKFTEIISKINNNNIENIDKYINFDKEKFPTETDSTLIYFDNDTSEFVEPNYRLVYQEGSDFNHKLQKFADRLKKRHKIAVVTVDNLYSGRQIAKSFLLQLYEKDESLANKLRLLIDEESDQVRLVSNTIICNKSSNIDNIMQLINSNINIIILVDKERKRRLPKFIVDKLKEFKVSQFWVIDLGEIKKHDRFTGTKGLNQTTHVLSIYDIDLTN